MLLETLVAVCIAHVLFEKRVAHCTTLVLFEKRLASASHLHVVLETCDWAASHSWAHQVRAEKTGFLFDYRLVIVKVLLIDRAWELGKLVLCLRLGASARS